MAKDSAHTPAAGAAAPPTKAAAPAGKMTRPPGSQTPTEDAHIFVNLPPHLAAEFEPVQQWRSGGQASLLLCRRLGAAPEELVVIKIFNVDMKQGVTDPRERFQKLDPAHVVRYVEPYFGQYSDRWWEVLEYCPAGTLREFALEHGGALTTKQVIEVTRELTDALDHIHHQVPQVVHRDIKPANVLVRSVGPLDLVLTDFGLAVLLEFSRERRSGSRTPAYAAPEAAGDTEAGPPLDWWSLGMTLAELAAGKHPFQSRDGLWLSDAQIISEVSARPVPLDGIKDARTLQLLRGLLTRDPDRRWRAVQVREWLEGGSPLIAADEGAQEARIGAGAVSGIHFNGVIFRDPVLLADAYSANWKRAASDVVAGRDFPELVDWVDEFFPERSLQRIAGTQLRQPVDRVLAETIVRLNPGAMPVFMGQPVDLAVLPGLPKRLADDTTGELAEIVEKLFASRALLAFSGLEGHEGLALVEGHWQDLCDQANNWFAAVGNAGEMTPPTRALILRVAANKVREGEVSPFAWLPDAEAVGANG